MDTCIFCKIISGTVPADVIYEDEHAIAFLDIFPRNPGHVQVVPKKHFRWVWDIEPIAAFMNAVQKVARAQKKAFDTELIIGLVAGEEVPHAHFWLVPRMPGDGHGGTLNAGLVKKMSESEMRDVAQKIRGALND